MKKADENEKKKRRIDELAAFEYSYLQLADAQHGNLSK